MSQIAPSETKRCPFCAEEIKIEAIKCRHCGQWLQGVPASPMTSTPVAQANAGALSPFVRSAIYDESLDLNQIPADKHEELERHELLQTLPVALVIILSFLTLGIFTAIYFGLKHSKLPSIKDDDFSAGKAIGFLFIPLFNLYWIFIFWLRLTDRINFQFRLREKRPPIDRGLVLATLIIGLVPYLCFVSWIILYPIVIGEIQSASNALAKEARASGGTSSSSK